MELHLELDPSAGPRRAQVERALRAAIQEGRLPAGSRLPATRQLAKDLHVSRGVIVEAYSQLAAEGYLHADYGAGTRVATGVALTTAPASTSGRSGPALRFDLDPTIPAVDGFPRAAWHAALGRALRTAPDESLGYGDMRGQAALRTALAASLGRRRGVRHDPAALLVTGGVSRGLPLVWSLLAALGVRRLGVEEPGWSRIRQTALRAGLELVEIGVDTDGLDTAAVRAAKLDAVVLTPAHQFPTGAVLSAERRRDLVAWAREHEAVIVEDDFDAEYRYDKQPVGALQGLAPDVVVHLGSASKMLAPALNLGWLILPPSLEQLLPDHPDEAPWWVDTGAPPAVDQLAFADLLERGEVDRHLRRQRRRYASRRATLLAALAEELPQVRVDGAAAGLFLVLRLPAGSNEDAIVQRANANGLRLQGVGASTPALAVGYATLPESVARAAAILLRETITGAGGYFGGASGCGNTNGTQGAAQPRPPAT